jgi:hypothetical protein
MEQIKNRLRIPRIDFMRASKRICVSVIWEPGILLLRADRALDAHNWQNPGALPKLLLGDFGLVMRAVVLRASD